MSHRLEAWKGYQSWFKFSYLPRKRILSLMKSLFSVQYCLRISNFWKWILSLVQKKPPLHPYCFVQVSLLFFDLLSKEGKWVFLLTTVHHFLFYRTTYIIMFSWAYSSWFPMKESCCLAFSRTLKLFRLCTKDLNHSFTHVFYGHSRQM